MSLPVRLLPEAKAEFDAAADWYEQQRPGLGVDFIARVRVVLNRIGTHPRIHAAVYGDVRKAVVARFPYVVLYREEAAEVVVIAVFHTARSLDLAVASLIESSLIDAVGERRRGETVNHIVLLGDSIFDNARYVPGGPSVIEHLRRVLPGGWRTTLLARDGAASRRWFGSWSDCRRTPRT